MRSCLARVRDDLIQVIILQMKDHGWWAIRMALPSDVRKGFAFPELEFLILRLRLATGRSPESFSFESGKAKPFRTSDGRAATNVLA